MSCPYIRQAQSGDCQGQQDGAKQRPRQSRRPSAAKRIIRPRSPKDTGPIYLSASFFDVSPTRHGLDDLYLFAVLADDQMADVDSALNTGAGTREMLKMLTQTLRMAWLHPRNRCC
jgi:hypothetical protein